MSSIASDSSRRSLRARLAACLLAASSVCACGGEADRNGNVTSGGAASGGAASGGAAGSVAGGQPMAGTGAAAGGSTAAGNGAGGAPDAGSGGQPSAGAAGDDWTLPHTSDKRWRNSREPLCAPTGYGLPLDVWSDERGVWALAETDTTSTSLSFNDGSGWSAVPAADGSYFGLSGIPNGPLILHSGNRCGVMFRDGDVETCVSAIPDTARVFVVDAERTFAIAGNRVLRYNGSYFTQYGKPLPESFPVYGFELWADAEVVIVAGELGVYVLGDESSEVEVIALPDAVPARSLWAFSRDDIWIGLDRNRLAHYDGTRWTLRQVGSLDCGGVNALWGSEGELFVGSSTFLGRVQHDLVIAFAEARRCTPEDTTVGQFEELVVKNIWGNSSTEVFFAVTERMFDVHLGESGYTSTTRNPDACGMQRLYWSDGATLRPL